MDDGLNTSRVKDRAEDQFRPGHFFLHPLFPLKPQGEHAGKMTSTMAETLAASLPAPAPAQAASAAPVAESIPASMAKLIDIEAEIPIETVQLDGLVSWDEKK